MNVEHPLGGARFATTRWSLVVAAGEGESPEGRDALETLCTGYWFPLYAFARRGGANPEDAQDLVQGFFARLLEKGYVRQADRERGRFRTFLLAAFRHYASNERAKERAEKRGGGARALPLDVLAGEDRYRTEPLDDHTPERVFERQWALALLDRVMNGLRVSYGGGGGGGGDGSRGLVFETLKPLLAGADPDASLADVSVRLGMSAGATRVALHRMRARYRGLLRDAIAETVADPAEVDDEIRHLLAALAPR